MKVLFFSILVSFLTGYAQQIHLQDYFPLQDQGRWIYKDESGNLDTAMMSLNTGFLDETNVEFSFGSQEKQYYKADITGLKLLGQTIPLGTFVFNSPLEISSLNAQIGEQIWWNDLRVTHLRTHSEMNWGSAYVTLQRFETAFTVLDSTYDSVLVIRAGYGNERSNYYLAKGRGIVKATSSTSPTFRSRELIQYVSAVTPTDVKLWQTFSSSREVRVVSDRVGEISRIVFPMIGSNIQVKIFNLKGKLMALNYFKNGERADMKIKGYWNPGNYVLQVLDGTIRRNRMFSILK